MANGDDSPDTPDNGEIPEPDPTQPPKPPPKAPPKPGDLPPGVKPPEPKGPKDWMDNLEGMDPENEQQALFYLGWMAGDVPPHVRAAARTEYGKKFGPLTSDEWKKWKEKMGYGDSA